MSAPKRDGVAERRHLVRRVTVGEQYERAGLSNTLCLQQSIDGGDPQVGTIEATVGCAAKGIHAAHSSPASIQAVTMARISSVV